MQSLSPNDKYITEKWQVSRKKMIYKLILIPKIIIRNDVTQTYWDQKYLGSTRD